MTTLINKAKVKAYSLSLAQATRGGKFTRVSPSYLDRVETKLRRIIHDEVHAHPSVGKTLK